MSKSWMMLTCMLSLGSVGTSQAHPLDSPDIVYIDGMPCKPGGHKAVAAMFGEHARDRGLVGLGGHRTEGERDLAKA
jgi:hypothetical protein